MTASRWSSTPRASSTPWSSGATAPPWPSSPCPTWLPIGLALGWPERDERPVGRIDWTRASTLEFQPVDRATFPLLDLAVQAGRQGATAPAALNAANEEAVAAFLEG